MCTSLASAGTAVALALAMVAGAAQAAPKVVATIAPIHSLVAMVTQGVVEPELLLTPGASPHEYALRPSDAVSLAEADVVVQVSDQLETFLVRPLATLAADARVVTLADVPGVAVLPAGDVDHPDHHGHDSSIDPHLWLDSRNAALWVGFLANILADTDPEHSAIYLRNAETARQRLEAMASDIRESLAPVRGIAYVVFHDAYRYFEAQFGMNAVGAVSVGDAQKPGAAHIRHLRDEMRDRKVVCLFTEPQFEPRLVATLIEGTDIRTGTLDPLGSTLAPGPDLYPQMMSDLAASLRECLG